MVYAAEVMERLKRGTLQRILAFGSSNTEHFLSGMHWFDCLDLALTQTYGRFHRSINTGIGGDTTTMLLDRFEQDAAFYQPHMAIITIGGNDSSPEKDISAESYRKNLLELHRRFCEMECAVIFQTYYAVYPQDNEEHIRAFHDYMQIMREVAKETGSMLIDQLALWEPFRLSEPEQYKKLMQDGFHVNYRGNMVMGLEIVRQLELDIGTDRPEFWEESRAVHQQMLQGRE